MFLTSLTLDRFRTHTRAQIALDARPVVVYGPNGAGKTSLLEAVSLLSPGRGLRRARALDLAQHPDPIGWKVTAQLSSQGMAHNVETRSDNGAARSVRIDDKTARQNALGRLIRVLWLVPSMDRIWIEGAEGRRRFLDRMTLSFEPGHGALMLDYEKALRERNKLIKDMVRDPAWYRALNERLARTGAAIHCNRMTTLDEMTRAGATAHTDFPRADLSLITEGEGGDPQALKAALEAGFARDMAAGRTLIGPHRTDLQTIYAAKGVCARACSTGEQKALLVSLILTNARALRARLGAAPVLLLDEIGAHLDTHRRAALYEELIELGAQAWMTGTEPDVFASLGVRAQYLAVHEDNSTSHIAPSMIAAGENNLAGEKLPNL